ncbi:RING/FYVE/PHD zinc finger superfamily protein [Rhynchospora pubera]|uniref:RING/FYVE/PHD zinc finger superfamily protein n=1 Tax=Rhynchospora pubera TaxID=906938 RepID=A0AAV8EHS5_9POAL|nr:RING/FYVE/PHD zinc finger superfamily protein [Rhynchospora pubera]
MKKRGDRTMSELYDRTQKIPRLKVEGSSCKEPLDQPVHESGGINENKKSPSRKRSIQDDDNSYVKPESGTCNVCNTPCSSCLHRMRVETDTCSFVGACSEHFHCENAETISKLRNHNKPKPFDVGIVKQEGQGESTSCLTNSRKQKDTQRLDSHKESSSDNCEESQEKKRFNSTDSQEKSDSNFRVSEKNNVLSKKLSGGLENCDTRGFSEKDRKQVHKVVEVKNQETDNGLIDVNVCDICGDTGREEQLATCSRCIDGAEHTYCMRVRLEKLPEGDWLCEECQLKDIADKEKQRRRPTQTTPLSTPLSEKENKSDITISKNPFSRHKKLRVSTDRAVYVSVPPPSPRKSFKELISPGKSSNLTREKLVNTETCSSKEVMSPRKSSNLSRENLLKMEICSPKDRNSGQILKKSHALSRSYSLSNVPLLRDVEKGQSEMPPPKGKMTKHLSFKNPSMKPKVKSMAESIPTKEKTSGFSLLKPTDEARPPFRRLIKSASLKEGSSTRANPDSLKLAKPSCPTVHINPPKSLETSREREKISLEKKHFKRENCTNVLAQQPGAIVKKIESKAEGSIPKKPEYVASFSRMEPAPGDKKMSKSVLTKQHQAYKDPRSVLSPKERDKKFNRLKTAVKSVFPVAKDGEKSETFDKPKLPILKSGVSYTSKNQKTISSNIRENSRSTFSDRSKVEKAPRDLLSAASSLEKEEPGDLDVMPPSVGVEKMKLPKDMLSRSSSLDKEKTLDINVITTAVGVDKTKAEVLLSRSSSLDEGKNRGINVITTSVRVDKIKAPTDILSQDRALEKPMDSNGISSGGEFKITKATAETLTDSNAVSVIVKHVELTPLVPVIYDSSSLGTPSRTLSIPEQDSVWQGSFEIMRGTTQAWESFDGIQAHFSAHVSPKVFDVVAKFSDKLKLEEVPWGTAWPGQFQEIKPSEEHVALFFFARDLESYVVSYSRLLQSLIADNLALRGHICGVELLIFPSDKLPEQSQRWNSLFYLWGIFCARKQAPPKTSLKSHKPIGGASGNFSTKINEDVKPRKELNIIDNLPKLKVEDVTNALDVGPVPYKKPGEQKSCLDPSVFCADREARNASHPASIEQSCAVKAEDANEMAGIISDGKVNNKTLSLEKPTDAKLKPGNEGAYLSDGTSYDELDLKRKREHDDSHIETAHKRSTLLNKLVSPKIHPLSIDLEKPAQTCDLYSTEDVEGARVGDAGQSKLRNNLVNVIPSDDEDVALKMPNLNLALGNKNPWQKEVLPLPLFPLLQAKEEESDASLSLSLTIAPPGSEKGMEKPAGKMQQFLPEKPGVKEPLRLFGGYISR